MPCEYTRTLPLSGIALRQESVPEDRDSLASPVADAVRLSADPRNSVAAEQRGSALLLFGTDGLEDLSPPVDERLTEEVFSRYLSAVPSAAEADAPRLVHGFYWYYAAYSPTAEGLLPLGRYSLTFPSLSRTVSAQLLHASSSGKGQLLLFRLALGDPCFLSLRYCEALLCFSPVPAFSLPVSALAFDKTSYVLLQTKEDPVFIPVTVLFQDKDHCLIQPGNALDLPAGSRVLLDADEYMEERNEYSR